MNKILNLFIFQLTKICLVETAEKVNLKILKHKNVSIALMVQFKIRIIINIKTKVLLMNVDSVIKVKLLLKFQNMMTLNKFPPSLQKNVLSQVMKVLKIVVEQICVNQFMDGDQQSSKINQYQDKVYQTALRLVQLLELMQQTIYLESLIQNIL